METTFADLMRVCNAFHFPRSVSHSSSWTAPRSQARAYAAPSAHYLPFSLSAPSLGALFAQAKHAVVAKVVAKTCISLSFIAGIVNRLGFFDFALLFSRPKLRALPHRGPVPALLKLKRKWPD